MEKEGDGVLYETSARKPHWDSGAAVPLSLKKKQSAPVPQAAPKVCARAPSPYFKTGSKAQLLSGTQVWNVSADDQDEFMDEDALLNEQDLKPSKPKVHAHLLSCEHQMLPRSI